MIKILASSGTTGSQPSRIFLDRETAEHQRQALVNIMTPFFGPDRLNMLIVDTPAVVTAADAGLRPASGGDGHVCFGRNHCFALDDTPKIQSGSLALPGSKNPKPAR